MKKFKFLFAALLVCMGMTTTLTACSDDDDKQGTTPAATAVAGSYTGDMTCTVMSSASTFESVTFTLTATDESTVSLVIPSFGEPPMQLPSITLTGLTVTGSDGAYAIPATEFSGTTDEGKAYSGTLQGTYLATTETLSLDISLNYGAMPMAMILDFEAPKN